MVVDLKKAMQVRKKTDPCEVYLILKQMEKKDKAREDKIKELMAGWTPSEEYLIFCPFCGCRKRRPKMNGDGYYRCKVKGCNKVFRLFDGGN
jgi:hypothetical protein